MKKWYWVVTAVILAVQITIALLINYPPTWQQLQILNRVGLGGELSLWLLRLITLLGVIGLILICKKYIELKIFRWLVILWLLSPISLMIWMQFPLTLLKLLMVAGIFYIGRNRNKCLVGGLSLILVIIFNYSILNNHPAVFNKLFLKDAKNEVTARFTAEDSLLTKVTWPLWWRRIGYNKYFFAYKQVVAEFLPFFDLETIFFQEVTPTGQKSIVMWYWPEFYLFLIGCFFLLKKGNKKLRQIVITGLILAIVNFVFSEGSFEWRLLLVMWPTSIILAIGLDGLVEYLYKGYWQARATLILGVSLLLIAWCFNSYDLVIRKEYWLDNRPLTFEFWYKNIIKIDKNNYQKVYVSSLVGNSKEYCLYYLGKQCLDNNIFSFNSFNLKDNKTEPNTIYAGFAGEFVGPNFKNEIEDNWQEIIKSKGMEIKAVKDLHDSIANQYGDSVAVAIKQ